jgi:hypothetical protein
MPPAAHAGDILREIRPVVEEPEEAPLEAREPVQQLRLQRLDREQGDQADHMDFDDQIA